jgi:uncharacterized glyoxalase superfamily protein PhnB
MAITPYLLYQDVEAALKFLAKAFGFKKSGDQHRGEDGKINHAAMQLEDHSIMMGYPGPKYKNPKQLGERTQMLYIDVDDVESHFRRAKKAGARIIEEPKDTFYGARRYGAEDPEGHQWYFAQELPQPPAKKRAAKG